MAEWVSEFDYSALARFGRWISLRVLKVVEGLVALSQKTQKSRMVMIYLWLAVVLPADLHLAMKVL